MYLTLEFFFVAFTSLVLPADKKKKHIESEIFHLLIVLDSVNCNLYEFV